MTEPITASKLKELADRMYERHGLVHPMDEKTISALRSAADQLDALSAKHKRAVDTIKRIQRYNAGDYPRDMLKDIAFECEQFLGTVED